MTILDGIDDPGRDAADRCLTANRVSPGVSGDRISAPYTPLPAGITTDLAAKP